MCLWEPKVVVLTRLSEFGYERLRVEKKKDEEDEENEKNEKCENKKREIWGRENGYGHLRFMAARFLSFTFNFCGEAIWIRELGFQPFMTTFHPYIRQSLT